MEVNAKVKELEDEVKVLKAEIRNVLLDIREAILDNSNPLSDQEPAYLRMDLNTTARALASEEAARAAREAVEQATGKEDTAEKPEEPEDAASADLPPEEEAMGEEPTESETEEPEAGISADLPPEDEAAAEAIGEEPTESEPEEPELSDDGGLPPKGNASPKGKARPEATLDPRQISSAYLTALLPTGAAAGLAAWVTEAMAAIGPQDLERVIAIHRLWGSLPPNISYALAHLQRLIRSSQEADPPWLKTMRELERLASC